VKFLRFLKVLAAWIGDEIYGLFISAEPEERCEHPDAGEDGP
jgi:hypothetical protein